MRHLRPMIGFLCLTLAADAARAQWSGTAEAIADAAGAETLLDAASDGYYGLLVAWRSGNGVYAQRMNPIAERKWDATGILVANTGLADTRAAVAGDGVNSGYVAWEDDLAAGTGRRIYVMRLRREASAVPFPVNLTFTIGSPDVTATAANGSFTTDVDSGELIRLDADGQWIRVGSVTDDDNLVLAGNYPDTGGGVPGGASMLKTYKKLSGTLSFSAAGTQVTGTGTYFLTELAVGNYIRLDSDGTWAKIASITDDATLDLAGNYSSTAAGRSSVARPMLTFRTAVSPVDEDCRRPRVIGTAHGAYVVHENHTLGVTVGATTFPLLQLTYVGNEGVVLWDTDIGFCHSDPAKADVRIFPDGSDGVIVVFNQPPYANDDGLEPNSTWAVRVDTLGEGVWGNDPVKLWQRKDEAATVTPDGQGGLWVAGTYYFPDVNPSNHTPADGGYYIIANHLEPDGTFAWDPWVKAFEWDAYEKRTRVDTWGTDETLPGYSDYYTDQDAVGLVPDGEGGVYVLSWDNRAVTDGAVPPPPPPRPQDYKLYAQKVGEFGAPQWNEDDSGWYLAGYDVFGSPVYYSYPWTEGAGVRATDTAEKVSASAHCGYWSQDHPIDGYTLYNQMTSVWIEGTDLLLAELDVDGVRRDWNPPGGTYDLDVLGGSGLGAAAAGGYALKVVCDERFGTYMVWNADAGGGNGDGVFAIHANHWVMWEDFGRVMDSVGPGPDIFPPAVVADFGAKSGAGDVELWWTNPLDGPKPLEDFAGTMIRRSTAGPPLTPDEGEFIYSGSDVFTESSPFSDEDVTSGVVYYYSAFTFDTEFSEPNYSSPVWTSVSVTWDDVQNFQAQGVGTDTIHLSWENPVGGNYAGVVICVSTTGYPTSDDLTLQPIPTLLVAFDTTETEYTHTSLTTGTRYYYTAFAHDDTGDPLDTVPANRCDFSDGARASAVPVGPVVGLSAGGQDRRVNLTWTNPASSEYSGVVICRDDASYPTSPDQNQIRMITDPTATSYVDAPLVNGTRYYYSVFAMYDIGGLTVYAVPAMAEVVPADYVPPADISDLTAVAGIGYVNLYWTNPTDEDFMGVLILRRAGSYPTSPDDLVTDPDVVAFAHDRRVDGDPVPEELGDAVDIVNGTMYYYAMWAFDDEESPNFSANPALATAMPVDNFAPAFTLGPNASAGTTTATITWRTSESTTAVLRYGVDSQTVLADPTAEIHFIETITLDTPSAAPYDATVTITGLRRDVPYYFELVVTDSQNATASASGLFSTSPLDASEDTDGDGMLDSWETDNFLNVGLDDSGDNNDTDSLTNLQEYYFDTDPGQADTDGDGIDDDDEARNGSDPTKGYFGPISEDEGCGMVTGSGGAPLAWALLLGAAAFALLRKRREAGAR